MLRIRHMTGGRWCLRSVARAGRRLSNKAITLGNHLTEREIEGSIELSSQIKETWEFAKDDIPMAWDIKRARAPKNSLREMKKMPCCDQ